MVLKICSLDRSKVRHWLKEMKNANYYLFLFGSRDPRFALTTARRQKLCKFALLAAFTVCLSYLRKPLSLSSQTYSDMLLIYHRNVISCIQCWD